MNKQKFTLESLEPFDKILVREDDKSQWKPQIFARFIYNKWHIMCAVCIGDIQETTLYEEVVPYNEDTKHLCYSYEQPPEFYNR